MNERRRTRIAAYALCHDADRRVLLCRIVGADRSWRRMDAAGRRSRIRRVADRCRPARADRGDRPQRRSRRAPGRHRPCPRPATRHPDARHPDRLPRPGPRRRAPQRAGSDRPTCADGSPRRRQPISGSASWPGGSSRVRKRDDARLRPPLPGTAPDAQSRGDRDRCVPDARVRARARARAVGPTPAALRQVPGRRAWRRWRRGSRVRRAPALVGVLGLGVPVAWRARCWSEPAGLRLRFVHVAGGARHGRHVAHRAARRRRPFHASHDRARLRATGSRFRGVRRSRVHASDRRADPGDVQGTGRGDRSGPTVHVGEPVAPRDLDVTCCRASAFGATR